MKIINTRTTDLSQLSPQESEWVYNGLDGCQTIEIDEATERFVTPEVERTYNFTFRQLRPILAMMIRGMPVDEIERRSMFNEKSRELVNVEAWLQELGEACGFGPINPRSPQQLKRLFYTHLKFNEVVISQKGERKVSTNRESLEKLYNQEFYARPFIQAIFGARDLSKLLSVLKTKIENGRFQTTFNPAGTGTGRYSSTESPFGTGSNIQNITAELRKIFVPDKGMVIAYSDLEQAESRGVAYYSGDENYIAACESGDLHTYCARLIWPELPWNGDIKKDKAIAERPFYRHFSYRDMSKRGGHAYNYFAKPWTVARHLKIEQYVAEQFHESYFGVFTQIPGWWKSIAQELWDTRTLRTAMGRRRIFFGRLDDAELRKAIAFIPQSTIVDILNTGQCKVWEKMDPWLVQLLAQIHDALVYQVPEDNIEIYRQVEDNMLIDVPINGRVMRIPVETKMGYNWKDLTKAKDFKPYNRPTRTYLEIRL